MDEWAKRWDDDDAAERARMDRIDRAIEQSDIAAVLDELDERRRRRAEGTRRLLEDIARA